MTRFLLAETDYNGDAGDWQLLQGGGYLPTGAQRVRIMRKKTYYFPMAYEINQIFKDGFVPAPEMTAKEITANIQAVKTPMPFEKVALTFPHVGIEKIIEKAHHHTITPYESGSRWEVAVYFEEHAYTLDIESLDEFLRLEGNARQLLTDEFEFLDGGKPEYVLVLE